MKKRLLGLMLMGILSMGILSGCVTDRDISVDQKQAREQEQQLSELNRQIGLPEITNYHEKKMAKKIFELRDKVDLTTYAYTQNMDGKYVYLGKCVGYGLPYSVQYTNPEKLSYEKVIKAGRDGSDSIDWAWEIATLPQADPNGLFMPEGLSATWLMIVNEDTGEQEIMYAEPEIVVTQSKLPKRLCEDWSLPENY